MTAVQEEEYARQVRFDSGNEPPATIKVEELGRICEDTELGEIGFQFVRQLRGNALIDGKIECISSNNKFVCRFDDGDLHTYSRNAMTTMMAKNFPEISNMSKLDRRTSADAKESEAELRESNSEEETLEIISENKGERANEQSESESESEHEEEDESGSDRKSGSSVRELHDRASIEKTNQYKSTNIKSPTESKWNYRKWLMGKSLEES